MREGNQQTIINLRPLRTTSRSAAVCWKGHMNNWRWWLRPSRRPLVSVLLLGTCPCLLLTRKVHVLLCTQGEHLGRPVSPDWKLSPCCGYSYGWSSVSSSSRWGACWFTPSGNLTMHSLVRTVFPTLPFDKFWFMIPSNWSVVAQGRCIEAFHFTAIEDGRYISSLWIHDLTHGAGYIYRLVALSTARHVCLSCCSALSVVNYSRICLWGLGMSVSPSPR